MNAESLKIVGGIAGLAGIAVLLLFIFFNNALKRAIADDADQARRAKSVTLMMVLATIIAVAGISAWMIAILNPPSQEMTHSPHGKQELQGQGKQKMDSSEGGTQTKKD